MASQFTHPLDARGFSKPKVAQNAITLFVHATNGDDNNPGTDVNRPLKTLAVAVKRIQKTTQTVVALSCGQTWNEPLGSLKGGPSSDNPTIITSYGKGSRPVIAVKNGDDGVSLNNLYNVAIIGLALVAVDRTAAPGPNGDPARGKACNGLNIWQGSNILVEDCEISFFKFNILCQGPENNPVTNVTFRRNLVHDNWTWDGYSQGAYLYAAKSVTFDGNYFLRCGWNDWCKPNIYNHGTYVNATCDGVTLSNHYVYDCAATGWQARSGGDVTDYLAENFAIGLTWGLVNGGGHVKVGGVVGDLSRLVFIGNKGLYEDTKGSIAKRGNALAVGNVAKGTITDIICQHDSQRWFGSPAISLEICQNADGESSVGVQNLSIDGLYCMDWPLAITVNKTYTKGGKGPTSINQVKVSRSHTEANNGMMDLLSIDNKAPVTPARDPDRNPDKYVAMLNLPYKTYHEAVVQQQNNDTFDSRLEPKKVIEWILLGYNRTPGASTPTPIPTPTPAGVLDDSSGVVIPAIPQNVPAGRVYGIGVVDANGTLRRQITVNNGGTIPLTSKQTLVFFRILADVAEIRTFAQNAIDAPKDGQLISQEVSWPNCFFGGSNGANPAFNANVRTYLTPGKHFLRTRGYRNGLPYGSHFDVLLQVTQ